MRIIQEIFIEVEHEGRGVRYFSPHDFKKTLKRAIQICFFDLAWLEYAGDLNEKIEYLNPVILSPLVEELEDYVRRLDFQRDLEYLMLQDEITQLIFEQFLPIQEGIAGDFADKAFERIEEMMIALSD